MGEPSQNKRVRDGSDDLELNSPEVKRLREDLLGGLDDSDPSSTASQDLDSFIKSFQDEITASPARTQVVEPGESVPDLDYLLEASDDELGLPPSTTPVSDVAANEEVERNEFSELWMFDEQIPSYDSFEFEISGLGVNGYEDNLSVGEFVEVDGLFDYSDCGGGKSDVKEVINWRSSLVPE